MNRLPAGASFIIVGAIVFVAVAGFFWWFFHRWQIGLIIALMLVALCVAVNLVTDRTLWISPTEQAKPESDVTVTGYTIWDRELYRGLGIRDAGLQRDRARQRVVKGRLP